MTEVDHQPTSQTMTSDRGRGVEGLPARRDPSQTRSSSRERGGTVAAGGGGGASGLSRMIRGLFPPSPSPSTGGRWSAAGVNPLRDRFTTRVARYLQGGPSQRDRLVAGILDDGASLAEAGEDQAVAQAFQALLRRATDRSGVAGRAGEAERRFDGEAPASASHSDHEIPGADRDILALAAELVGHRAAVRVLEDLLAAPDGEGESELIVVAAALPERMIPALSHAMERVTDASVRQALARIQARVPEWAGRAVPGTGAISAARNERPATEGAGERRQRDPG